ncbi:family 16 glycoside hydrolase [Prosthecobacter vanneervenii]|uniref:3-keto-alpha-glucoside-1,2-lyase/3-keto-2-hydroxy-glucal hydratase domain-containing protein n=1 Tax=Prosthecobacter vanneervenii TaxID=48466 RepID=A0A7W8DJD1_9BACT|nr:family 16 glycoside hydrolase [Prosthecobacter vanneervenii]MBB5032028.1 hypothetical protein [Prosthecobacter vanneervenii]
MKFPAALTALLVLGTAFAIADDKPVAAKPEAGREIVLFNGKSLDDWEMVDVGGSGQVELEGGLMLINQGENISGAVYKKAAALPMINYEITLEAKRMQGVDFFVGLTFPVGDVKHCATLVCGGWGGSVTGISSIDGLDASENNTSSYQRYNDNQWYPIKLRVTAKNLSAWVGDKQVIDEDIEGKKISVRPGPVESYLPLSFTTYNTMAAIRNVKLTTIAEPK